MCYAVNSANRRTAMCDPDLKIFIIGMGMLILAAFAVTSYAACCGAL